MRIEDLDEGRVRQQYMETQLQDLRWLGLDWDEGPDVGGAFGPYLQSQRRERYEAVLTRLAEQGLLYECYCSRKEIAAAASAPHGPQEEGPVYPGTCRELTSEQRRRRRRTRTPALRFRVPREEIRFRDRLFGEQVVRPWEETGDFVVQRRDGVAAYQLAVVVDDIAMQISDVVRGADLLPSTARQLLVYDALDSPPPAWIHVPLLLDPDGDRLSKRFGATALVTLREAGVRAEEVVAWLAGTCGLAAPGEQASARELVDRYSVDRLPREATRPRSIPWE